MTTLDPQQLGHRIRELRLSLGWSQAELAEQLVVSFQQIQKYETGQNCPRLVRLLDLCEAFGLTMVELLDELVPDHLLTPASDPLLRLIVHKSRSLNRVQKKHLLQMITVLFNEE